MSAAAVLLLHLGLSLQTPTITTPFSAEPVQWGVRTTWKCKKYNQHLTETHFCFLLFPPQCDQSVPGETGPGAG